MGVVLIDSNVLVYANSASAPMHAAAAAALTELDRSGEVLWISRRTIRECLVATTRLPYLPVSVRSELAARVRAWERRYRVAEDGPDVTARLLKLFEQVLVGGKQVHDANLVATMLVHGIDRLLTHNTADFDRFEQWIEVLPLSRWAT
ncbi:MAG: type II toxin-antitoxin system VapC family toxin [Armatimonadetes bacterium]|nr:type II toxin-antitoxin system VapC family toxin [Armatimonadota bacterium]